MRLHQGPFLDFLAAERCRNDTARAIDLSGCEYSSIEGLLLRYETTWAEVNVPGAGASPLHGKRVMFTSPRQYAHKLASKLVEKGAGPIWLPGVEITSLTDVLHQQACLDMLHLAECLSLDAALQL